MTLLKMNATLLFIALCTVVLEPDTQFFFRKPVLCQTIVLGVNQIHGVVSLGAVFSRSVLTT